MADQQREHSRRTFLRRMTVATVGAMAARGVYDFLDEIIIAPERAEAAATVRRKQEQYLVNNVEVILDNGVTLAIPPLHNDVFTATLSSKINWTTAALKNAQSRVEKALQTVEQPYSDNASGLTLVVGWGLSYFDKFVSSQASKMPVDVAASKQAGTTVYAVQKAVQFPSDPDSLVLEDNHVMFKMRSDSADILRSVESQLFDNPSSGAYIGDLFDLTSKRIGFLGRGFGASGTSSIAKQMALSVGVPGADLIPDRSQLMMGFTSTQTAALGPDNIPSFETLPGVTNQFPSGYFAAGCAMHLSHIFIDLQSWYGSGGGGSYGGRVARMFSPDTKAGDSSVVTYANGPGQVATAAQVKTRASSDQLVGHNSAIQQATRLGTNVTDNYGRVRPAGTAVPLREDFNTVDNPFAWTSQPSIDVPVALPWGTVDPKTNTPVAAGLHFVAFVPATSKFHAARFAMDGVLPDGTNLRTAPYNLSDAEIGINSALHTSHRQNYLIPPRAHRSFPLVELLK